MTLYDDFKNMLKDLNNNKNKNKDHYINKYNNLYNSSENLFNKIYENKCNSNDIEIISTMLKLKEKKDKGTIDKLSADKKIGNILCDTYVKPMLKKDNK
tara:strand:+ start:686 stop:982 length:297 start_codon:yes stop_codon:yes gene_type:complete